MRTFYQTCPLCGSTNCIPGIAGDATKHRAFKPGLPTVLQWMNCQNCDHEFTESYWSSAGLAIVFQVTMPEQTPLHDFGKNRAISARMIEKVPTRSGRWLDIGVGNGVLMVIAQEYGFEASGTELRQQTRVAFEQLKLTVTEDIPLDGTTYDVISACDVLEHIPFPVETLKYWRTRIHKGGHLLLSCPNRDMLVWNLMNDNPYYFELEHFHNFGFKRLVKVLNETGWGNVRYGISERYIACMEIVAEAV